ncbi:DNA primase [Methanomicrobiaceae archaeon CYW5]|uniref:DNA primase catalytic subunit PriS n=1 Tax=Methanovulcanius yangii TaxID=1789227 RepID=UPI0029CA6F7A|nr:DNA primase catalytic subunit PriS [Methanovulcanius yangii]MBT8507187.1 DNA primase [Methanovulcanius yangii]
MNPATLEYVKQKFHSYYSRAFLPTPPSLEQREWGFIFFDQSPKVHMRRHMAFHSRDEVTSYVRTMVPRHMYFSTAYYALPSAATMNEKEWCGADLIFDLDADHIVQKVPYEVMLERVKAETFKLIAMLTDELGFSEKSLHLVFSGGRGYHIHIRDLEIRQWESAQRRELVDYVCGIGLDPAIMLQGREGDGGGWPLRYREALMEEVQQYLEMERGEALRCLAGKKGIGKGSAEKFMNSAVDLVAALSHPSTAVIPSRVLQLITSEEYPPLKERIASRAALTDEPVTTDVKRLIRAPASLHGGSGLRVVELSGPKDLEAFDPLCDAVVDFGEGMVNVDCAFPLAMTMMGEKYTLTKGLQKVPEEMAVFLCCRGIAEIAAVAPPPVH